MAKKMALMLLLAFTTMVMPTHLFSADEDRSENSKNSSDDSEKSSENDRTISKEEVTIFTATEVPGSLN